jgi:hypothetical protein
MRLSPLGNDFPVVRPSRMPRPKFFLCVAEYLLATLVRNHFAYGLAARLVRLERNRGHAAVLSDENKCGS